MLWPRRIWWAPADIAAIEWPLECATCGARLSPEHHANTARQQDLNLLREGGAETTRERDAEGGPTGALEAAHPHYCSTCRDTQARQAARARALGAVALLAAAVTALAFPLLEPRAPLAAHLLAATALALLPIAGLGSARPLAAWGSAPRVYGLGPLGTCVERRAIIGHLRAGHWRALWLPPIAYRIGWSLIPALALGLSVLAYDWHHPRLWVINLGRERLWLAIDGVLTAALDPAGSDPARAALELRLPRGERELEAFDERHQRVASVRAVLEGGRDHLYAPASAAFCFWLESTGYGRDATRSIRPLASGARFFALDTDVDSWFVASPEPPAFDRRSSGGTLTALRQSPCARAPESVRQAASAIGP
jgi:hypothetical protein